MNNNNQATHIDLFAGAGGTAIGLNASGINTLVAIEHVESSCETYEVNHPQTRVVCEDIRKVRNQKIKKIVKELGYNSVDIVSAGFPCETFSTAGYKSRVYDDHRNDLYKEAIRIAEALKAKVIFFENVPAFLTKRIERNSKEIIYDHLVKNLRKAGYKYYHHEILNASHFGVPQNRSRFIMIANKTRPIKNFNLNRKRVKVTVSKALSDLPQIGPESESTKYKSKPLNKYQKLMRSYKPWGITNKKGVDIILTYHVSPKHRSTTIERFGSIKQGENLKDLFDKLSDTEFKRLRKRRVLPKKWYIQRNFRLIPNEPSKTVTTHCLDELIHPYLDRGLSVREVARLQSFPDWYDFKGGPFLTPHMYKTQDKYEQIGDAVPPLMALELGRYIQEEYL